MRRPNYGFDYRHVLIVLIAGWLLRFLFVWWMPPDVRSCDLVSWRVVAKELQEGLNPYRENSMLNWPPFWLQMIYFIYLTAKAIAVPFIFVLRFFLAGFETLVVLALFRLFRQVAPQERPFVPILLGIALNPATIFLICQHGNFDVIVGLWVLLFVFQLIRYHRSLNDADWQIACLFLGLGILTKTVPLVLCPMLAGGWRRASWQVRLVGTALVLGPVALGMSVIYVLAPEHVTNNVLGYRSAGGWFGISGLLYLAGADNLISMADKLFYLLLAGTGVAVAMVFWKRARIEAREIILCAALILMSVPTFGPGYGPQYLYWHLPLLIAAYVLYPGLWRQVLVASGIVMVATYLVEYAIIPSHGRYFYYLMLQSGLIDMSSTRAIERMNWWTSETGQVLIRLPLFSAFLSLFVVGIRMLVQNLRGEAVPMEPKMAQEGSALSPAP